MWHDVEAWFQRTRWEVVQVSHGSNVPNTRRAGQMCTLC